MANSAKMLEDDKERVAGITGGAIKIGDAVARKRAGFGFTLDGGSAL
jgi:hypothetical protein